MSLLFCYLYFYENICKLKKLTAKNAIILHVKQQRHATSLQKNAGVS